MRIILLLSFILLSVTCVAQKQTHQVNAPAYHTTHGPPHTPDPDPKPKARKDARFEKKGPKVFVCSKGSTNHFHSTKSCVLMKVCRSDKLTVTKEWAITHLQAKPCDKCIKPEPDKN